MSPKRNVAVLVPRTSGVTFCGNRVMVAVIFKGRSFWSRMGPWSSLVSVLTEEDRSTWKETPAACGDEAESEEAATAEAQGGQQPAGPPGVPPAP